MADGYIISTSYDHGNARHDIVSILDGDNDYRMSGEGVPGDVYLPAQHAMKTALTRARAKGHDVTRVGTVIRDERSGTTIVVEGEQNTHRKDANGAPAGVTLD